MKINFKNVALFALILLLWNAGGILFPYNEEFYTKLSIPPFALPGIVIGIVWAILYILITISVYRMIKNENALKNNDYLYVLITNYLANQLFSFTFWNLMSPFLAFIMTTITLISSIFLFIETKNIDKKSSYFLIPYMIFNIYAFITSLSIYIMNF